MSVPGMYILLYWTKKELNRFKMICLFHLPFINRLHDIQECAKDESIESIAGDKMTGVSPSQCFG